MPQTLRDPSGLKMLLSASILAYLVILYLDFLSDLGDLYPDMIWDEVVSGLLGLGLVLAWYRTIGRKLKH
jgi:ABC-type Mn2+/Zn2+ transport system permease subunit